MSFWKTILGIGGAAAAPFTGGASLWPTIAAAAIPAGAGIAGAIIGSKSNNKAAAMQSDAAAKALDFAKQQYADAVKNYAPYLQASQGALQGMQALMAKGQPVYTDPRFGTGVNPIQPGNGMADLARSPMQYVGGGQTPGAATNGPPKMVLLKAPNGQTRQFAANDPRVQQFLTVPDKNGQVAQRVA